MCFAHFVFAHWFRQNTGILSVLSIIIGLSICYTSIFLMNWKHSAASCMVLITPSSSMYTASINFGFGAFLSSIGSLPKINHNLQNIVYSFVNNHFIICHIYWHFLHLLCCFMQNYLSEHTFKYGNRNTVPSLLV